MKAIISIGGRGTRMRPVTFSANKHFIPVANKMLIEYPIETIVAAGITEIAITYNPGQLEFAQQTLGDGSKWGAKFTYILQEKPQGLANIFQVCEEWLNEDSFVFHLGDNIFPDGIKDVVDYFQTQKPNALAVYVPHLENTRLGVPRLDNKGRLLEYIEKPKDPPNNYGIPGAYFFDKNVFKCFKGKNQIKPSARGEYEISEPYNWLIKQGYRVDAIELKSKWLDPGKFNDWLETNQYLLDAQTHLSLQSQPDESSRIEGRVTIGENCTIEHSIIRGPVNIGNNVVIKDSFIGPFTSIAHNCQIDHCRIENSVLMNHVIIDHAPKPIDTSLIGPDCQISGNSRHGNMEMFLGELSKIVI